MSQQQSLNPAEEYEQYLGPTISIGLVAEFAKQNALDFTQADGGITLLEVDDVTGKGFGINRPV